MNELSKEDRDFIRFVASCNFDKKYKLSDAQAIKRIEEVKEDIISLQEWVETTEKILRERAQNND